MTLAHDALTIAMQHSYARLHDAYKASTEVGVIDGDPGSITLAEYFTRIGVRWVQRTRQLARLGMVARGTRNALR